MNCSVHHDKEASFRCFECGEVICKECATEMNGKIVCKKCFEKQIPKAANNSLNIDKSIDKPIINNRYTGKYNSFWAFIFSLIPGAGQMYFGLMKRGLQIMLLFAVPIFLANMLYSIDGVLILLNFIIWFYSFFDSQHIRKAINEGQELDDTLIWDINIQGINYKHVGVGLIAVGGLTILNNGFYRLSDYINTHFSNDFYHLFRFVRQSSFPVLLIIIGVFLLKKAKVQKED